MNTRDAYNMVHDIIFEQQNADYTGTVRSIPTDKSICSDRSIPSKINNDPKLMIIKKKAAELSAMAELEQSKNKLKKAGMERDHLEDEESRLEDEKSVMKKREDEEEIKFPRESEPEQEEPEVDEKQFEESLTEADEDFEDDEVPPHSDEPAESNIEISGVTSQNEEEAKISQIQAKTREIQAKIGEYTPPGGEVQGDEGEEGMEDEGGDEIDPMTGMPVAEPEPPDPIEGFGDTTDPNAQQDMMMGGMGGMDPMTGQPMDDSASKTPSAIGRLYMMKKIYTRLSLLDNILINCPDQEINELREDTKEAFEVFKLIANNLKSFKDKADEIIIDYYILVRDITKQLEAHFKQRKMMSEDQY